MFSIYTKRIGKFRVISFSKKFYFLSNPILFTNVYEENGKRIDLTSVSLELLTWNIFCSWYIFVQCHPKVFDQARISVYFRKLWVIEKIENLTNLNLMVFIALILFINVKKIKTWWPHYELSINLPFLT